MKLNRKSRGLGDTVEKITTVTGIKAVVDKISQVSGKSCGCKERRDALNRTYPYNNNK